MLPCFPAQECRDLHRYKQFSRYAPSGNPRCDLSHHAPLITQGPQLLKHSVYCPALPMKRNSCLGELLCSQSWLCKAVQHEVYQSFRGQVLWMKHLYQSTFGQQGGTHQLFLPWGYARDQQGSLAQGQQLADGVVPGHGHNQVCIGEQWQKIWPEWLDACCA